MLRLIGAALALLVIGCGAGSPAATPIPIPRRPTPGPIIDNFPECQDSIEIGRALVGCGERCLPRYEVSVICSDTGTYAYAPKAFGRLRYGKTLEADERCPGGVRLWKLDGDPRPERPLFTDEMIGMVELPIAGSDCSRTHPGMIAGFIAAHPDDEWYVMTEILPDV